MQAGQDMAENSVPSIKQSQSQNEMYVNLKYLLLVLHQPHRDQEKVTSVGRKPKSPAHVVSLYQQDEGQLLAIKSYSLKFISNVPVPQVPNPKRNVAFFDLPLPPLSSAKL